MLSKYRLWHHLLRKFVLSCELIRYYFDYRKDDLLPCLNTYLNFIMNMLMLKYQYVFGSVWHVLSYFWKYNVRLMCKLKIIRPTMYEFYHVYAAYLQPINFFRIYWFWYWLKLLIDIFLHYFHHAHVHIPQQYIRHFPIYQVIFTSTYALSIPST